MTTISYLSKTTDGDPIYVAYSPEHPNCVAQGHSMIEAQHNLSEVMPMYLEHLAQHNLTESPVEITFLCGNGGWGMVISVELA